MGTSLTAFVSTNAIAVADINSNMLEVEGWIHRTMAAGDLSADALDKPAVFKPDFYDLPDTRMVAESTVSHWRVNLGDQYSWAINTGDVASGGVDADIGSYKTDDGGWLPVKNAVATVTVDSDSTEYDFTAACEARDLDSRHGSPWVYTSGTDTTDWDLSVACGDGTAEAAPPEDGDGAPSFSSWIGEVCLFVDGTSVPGTRRRIFSSSKGSFPYARKQLAFFYSGTLDAGERSVGLYYRSRPKTGSGNLIGKTVVSSHVCVVDLFYK
jgi:hypothetical protein